ncbi:MAG: hypothetical protein JSS79_10015 [Bacteroidetes bacterium]|nr:hypothetical protein [Bacteroidota bacterium]
MNKIEWMEKYMQEAEQMIYNNQVDEGLRVLNNLLYDEPGYGNLHNHIGWAYLYYTGDLEKAELHLKMAVKFNPEFAPPYLHLGSMYNRTGRFATAIDWLQKGLAKPSASRFAFLQALANAYEMNGDFRMAIKTYKEAAVASVVTHEVNMLMEGVKRCRKKRLALFFSF